MPEFSRLTFPSFDGTTISYFDSGAGDRVALLLHGFLVDGVTNFGPAERIVALMSSLAPAGAPPAAPAIDPAGRAGVAARLVEAGFRVLVPDMRGHGQSDKPDTVAGYQDRAMARDMVALLDRVGADRADLLGYSMGSVTTAHLIAVAPERVRSAALGGIGAAIVSGEPMDLPPELPVPDSLPRPLTFESFAEYAAGIVDGSAPPEGFGAVYAMLADQFGIDRRVAAAVLRGQLSDAVAPESLRAFERPVMVVNGDQDLAAVRTERAFEKYLPRVSFVRCRGDHLGAVLDPGFQAAVAGHFRAG
ncbi:MAG: alpha/beta fold hydrolase [Gemmatimonadales bacterium]